MDTQLILFMKGGLCIEAEWRTNERQNESFDAVVVH